MKTVILLERIVSIMSARPIIGDEDSGESKDSAEATTENGFTLDI